jgi:hypothetical protein
MRRTLLLLALVSSVSCLALGQSSAASARFIQNSNSSGTGGGAARCLRENLSIKEGATDAAMGGVRQTDFTITNNGSAPCTLKGYPRVELLNRAGRAVRRAKSSNNWVGGDDDKRPQSVTIEPGQTAWFRLNYNSGGAGHVGKPCPTYPKIRITPPGLMRSFTLRSDTSSCPGSDLEVSSVQGGTPQ